MIEEPSMSHEEADRGALGDALDRSDTCLESQSYQQGLRAAWCRMLPKRKTIVHTDRPSTEVAGGGQQNPSPRVYRHTNMETRNKARHTAACPLPLF